MYKKILLFLALLLIPFGMVNAESQNDMAIRLQGKLLLQVEDGGRIWYVSPNNKMRHEVRFDNAMNLFRTQTLGISAWDLSKIQIDSRSMDLGSDEDGDGVEDEVEARMNRNPFGDGIITYDKNFANKLKGRLLLDVEDRGRVWYVDFDGNRWHITWDNLMTLFRSLSLGITNDDLFKIEAPIVIEKSNRFRGLENSNIVVMTYCSMEGPFCLMFNETLNTLHEKYGDKVRFELRHFPLDFHVNAQKASEAVECAGDQGKYWEMVAQIYQLNVLGNMSLENIKHYASKTVTNSKQFNSCLDSGKYKNKVLADINEGIDKGVTGTPSTFINSIPVRGSLPYTQVEEILLSVIKGEV